MQNTLSRGLWLAVVFSAGCTSYQKTSLQEIETNPDKLVKKDVRVHYDGAVDTTVVAGRTLRERRGESHIVVPDSVVSLRVASVNYPVLSGMTISDAKMHGTSAPAVPLEISLERSRKVEIRAFSLGKTLLLYCGTVLVATLVYGVGFNY